MSLSTHALGVLVAAPLLVAACNQRSNTDTNSVIRSYAPEEDARVDQLAMGTLQQVDTDAGILVVVVDGEQLLFTFTEGTVVVGAIDRMQGLTGQEGTRVVIRYRDGLHGREALGIHVK
jgi:hypothetical protein